MAFSKLPNQVERIYMDPRMVEEIARDPHMLAEQGGSSQFMSSWGGSEAYKALANMDDKSRMTYAAFANGAGTVSEVADMTGLDPKDVVRAIKPLEQKGFLASSSIVDDTGATPEEFE